MTATNLSGYIQTSEEVKDEGDPLEENTPRIVAELHGPFAESARLWQVITK